MAYTIPTCETPISFQPGIPVTLGGTLELGFAHDVDSADLLTFLGHWTGDSPELPGLPGRSARSSLAVPEPQSYAALSLLAWLAAWSTRRRFLRATGD